MLVRLHESERRQGARRSTTVSKREREGEEGRKEGRKDASFPEPQRDDVRLLSLCRMRAADRVAIADERPVCLLSPSLFFSASLSGRPMHLDRIIGRSGAPRRSASSLVERRLITLASSRCCPAPLVNLAINVLPITI